MAIASNILSGIILAPFITIFSAISLATLQRSVEWVSSIAKSPQKGLLRQVKPFFKNIDNLLDRVLAGNKITVNTTNILLMAIVVVLIALVLSFREEKKPEKQAKSKSH